MHPPPWQPLQPTARLPRLLAFWRLPPEHAPGPLWRPKPPLLRCAGPRLPAVLSTPLRVGPPPPPCLPRPVWLPPLFRRPLVSLRWNGRPPPAGSRFEQLSKWDSSAFWQCSLPFAPAPAARWPRHSRHISRHPAVAQYGERSAPRTRSRNFGIDHKRLKLAFVVRTAAQELSHDRRDLTLGVTAWNPLQHHLFACIGHSKIGFGGYNQGKIR